MGLKALVIHDIVGDQIAGLVGDIRGPGRISNCNSNVVLIRGFVCVRGINRACHKNGQPDYQNNPF
jgi:hypothetical protein